MFEQPLAVVDVDGPERILGLACRWDRCAVWSLDPDSQGQQVVRWNMPTACRRERADAARLKI